jgi:hypothetical protein
MPFDSLPQQKQKKNPAPPPWMAFDSATYANGLLNLPASVAHPSFPHAAAWGKDGSGHSLVTRNSRDDLVGIIVGKISDHRLFCSPIGNYRPDSKFSTDFSNTKFQFTVSIPEEQALVPGFRNGITNLIKIQKAISTTDNNKYLLEDEGDLTSVRFFMKMFEKRVSLLEQMSANVCFKLTHSFLHRAF